MEIQHYFEPINLEDYQSSGDENIRRLGNVVKQGLNDGDKIQLAIFGVKEERGSASNAGCSEGPDAIRKYFYKLFAHESNIKLVDFGNIKEGALISDTYFAVQEVLAYCLKNDIFPIILGGSQDIAFANYQAYGKLEQLVNFVQLHNGFGLGSSDEGINRSNYLSKILLQQPNVLFNYSNMGYQSYFIDTKELDLLDELFFDIHRLGTVKNDMPSMEPVIRNADFLSFSLDAIQQSDAPANANASPNGFTGEQACQISRYAGLSDKLSSIGFYDLNPSIDDRGQSAHLVAQMIWYFIDGFYNRKNDFPSCNKNEYTKYTVSLDEGEREMIFYKSPRSDRWWMEVPYQASFNKKYARHLMLPCRYEDYLTANENEMPERWFQTFKKLKA